MALYKAYTRTLVWPHINLIRGPFVGPMHPPKVEGQKKNILKLAEANKSHKLIRTYRKQSKLNPPKKKQQQQKQNTQIHNNDNNNNKVYAFGAGLGLCVVFRTRASSDARDVYPASTETPTREALGTKKC